MRISDWSSYVCSSDLVDDLLMVINVPYVSQVYLIHRGTMSGDHFGPTFESSEVRLMREDEIPWDEIAFPTILHRLRRFFADRASGRYELHSLDLAFQSKQPQQAEVDGDAANL